MSYIKNIIYYLLIYTITFYQKIISPVIPARCRYYPTCSAYGKQALQWHGVRTGSWLLLKRLARCQPFGGHGIDFVPLPLASYHYCFQPPQNGITDLPVLFQPYTLGWAVYRDRCSYTARLNHLLR